MTAGATIHQPVKEQQRCTHCGEPCADEVLWLNENPFCCCGCKTVYEILSENSLCAYYSIDERAGLQQKEIVPETYAYLDEPSIRSKVIEFESENFCRVRFNTPAIHCVSCIWLLENLQKLHAGIIKSEVNFGRKTVVIDFKTEALKLSELAAALASVGYAPQIRLEANEKHAPAVYNKALLLKLAVAGFCFGNVMLFSFPEYFGLTGQDHGLDRLFAWLNVALSVPPLIYSGSGYLVSAWKSFRQKQVNIDVPIAAGLVALWVRSVWDISLHTGPGYLDSFTGLVFFLLIGRWFQDKTYESLTFDRDFKAYFPLAVSALRRGVWKAVVVFELEPDDTIRVRNMEVIPADGVLLDEEAYIDYSFVTGESRPTYVRRGEPVFAGGRLIGQPAEFRVTKKTSQSHLTSLWNSDAFRKPGEQSSKNLIDRTARGFTWAVLALALGTAFYWFVVDKQQMWLILTSVLMVACPCALALAAPFTYGSMLRVFGRHGLYLKNADVVEHLADIDAVVFDKTGTITHGRSSDVAFQGTLTHEEKSWVKHLTAASTHPLSRLITKGIKAAGHADMIAFKELAGKGITGIFNGKEVRVGAPDFVGAGYVADAVTAVYVAIDNEVKGYFTIGTQLRPDVQRLMQQLGQTCAGLISGDNSGEDERIKEILGEQTELRFNQTPHDKLAFIKQLQTEGKHVMMVGDGLNDSGALKQSNVGIGVTDDTGVFTPACDGILQGSQLKSLHTFISLGKSARTIVKTGFGVSFFYNVIALSVAASGHLTPLVAAVLMPLSSISVVGFTTLAVSVVAWKHKL